MPPERSRSRLVVICSRLPRICWIWLLTGPHCADWPLNSEKKPELSQPIRLACIVTRSSSACCLVAAFLIAADLFFLGGIAAAGAAVDGRQLSLKPDADRIGLRALLLRRRRRCAGGHLRERVHIGLCGIGLRDRSRIRRGHASKQHGAGQNPPGEGSSQRQGHIQPSITNPRGFIAEKARPRRHGAAKAASHSRFSGQRHVVSAAPVWQSGHAPVRLKIRLSAGR